MRAILALTCALIATSALANFHTFRIQELYTNADGTIQFLVLREAQSLNGEDVWWFKKLTSYRTGQSAVEFEFPRDLPTSETAQKYVLVATPAFAALGLITPDYVIPSGFLGLKGGQVDFAGVDAIAFDPLPSDGLSALFRDGSVGPNVARNFRGESASVKASPPPPATTPAVEYYYAAWDYYFLTSFPAEIELLDGGAYGGVWKRTGQIFNVWPDATTSSSPACRFFSTSFSPKSSHFYTPFATECAAVKTSADWQYEAVAFHIDLASATGLCTSATIPLYRLYNNGNGGAPNHRYTTSVAIFDAMRAQGWVFEGDGVTRVFACVPQ
jgi:hypothetical protein